MKKVSESDGELEGDENNIEIEEEISALFYLMISMILKICHWKLDLAVILDPEISKVNKMLWNVQPSTQARTRQRNILRMRMGRVVRPAQKAKSSIES